MISMSQHLTVLKSKISLVWPHLMQKHRVTSLATLQYRLSRYLPAGISRSISGRRAQGRRLKTLWLCCGKTPPVRTV